MRLIYLENVVKQTPVLEISLVSIAIGLVIGEQTTLRYQLTLLVNKI